MPRSGRRVTLTHDAVGYSSHAEEAVLKSLRRVQDKAKIGETKSLPTILNSEAAPERRRDKRIMHSVVEFKVVIPARYGSSRLPGKPLRLIAGKPMIEHVYQRAREAKPSEVIVATDDQRIADTVKGFGGQAVMTSATHASGTDRLAEVAHRADWTDDTIVVNLQGDEPLMDTSLIKATASDLAAHPSAGIATLATPLHSGAELFDPNVVKVVLSQQSFALYFSRAPIPWVRADFSHTTTFDHPLPQDITFYRHLGLYAYRTDVLRRFPSLPTCALEQAEALEQNRALYHGIKIHVRVVASFQGHGVDTEADLRRVESLLATMTQ